MLKLKKLLISFFGTGYLPRCPGTHASFACAIIYLLAGLYLPDQLQLICIGMLVLSIIFAFTAGKDAEEIYKKKDPGQFVLDEVAGYFVTVLFVPLTIVPGGIWTVAIIAFFLFRFLDIFKPWPARDLEKVPGTMGIMLDDIAAGIIGNIFLQLSFWAYSIYF